MSIRGVDGKWAPMVGPLTPKWASRAKARRVRDEALALVAAEQQARDTAIAAADLEEYWWRRAMDQRLARVAALRQRAAA